MPTHFEVKPAKSKYKPTGVYRFGEFQIDTAEGVLRRNGEKIPLNRRAFDVLRLLVERSGQVVSKQDFFDIVWMDTFVEDNSLTVAMTTLRKVLGDDAKNATFIENLPKKGYRFIAEVEEVDPHGFATAESVASERPKHVKSTSIIRNKRFLVGSLAACMACLAIVLGVNYYRSLVYGGPSAAPTQRPARISSIAVMPFEYQTPDLEYLSEGLADSIIANLGVLPGLRVINRNSAFQYKGRTFDPVEAGRELGVDSILTGKIVQEGNSVVISAELTNLVSATPIWSHRYEQKPGISELAIQNEISMQVADSLRTGRPDNSQSGLVKKQTDDPEAFRLYLKGRYHLNKRTEVGFEKALDFFDQAIERDPAFAKAYVGQANCYAMGGFKFLSSPGARPAMVDATLQKALEIDPELSDAHAVLGLNKAYYLWDWAGAEASYKRAIELDPNNANAYHWYAELLALHSRFDESFENYRLAQDRDPLSLPIAVDFAYNYVYAGNPNEGMKRLQALKARDPKFARIYSNIADIYHQKGMLAESLAETRNFFAVQDNKRDLEKIAILEDELKRYGPSGYFRKALQIFEGSQNLSTVGTASLNLRLGNREKALELLERAYADHDTPLVYINVMPEFAELRSDPRFVDLILRIGLTPALG